VTERHQLLAAVALLDERAETLAKNLSNQALLEIAKFDAEMEQVLGEAELITFADEQSSARRIAAIGMRHDDAIEKLGADLDELAGISFESTTRLKERILDLEDQINNNLELLQLGQAVQIVSHEFETSIRAVRNGLKLLDPWARSTPRLQPIVRDLRASFSHLDGYLRLFTPLQRRLHNEESLINGGEIETFLLGVFGERLERHDIKLEATPRFREFTLRGYPSTFYPVFVNLVDNAIHWLSDSTSRRTISLSSRDDFLEITDSGPGVQPRDFEFVFERGFTRRRGGRGLGLSLASELLARDGWSLSLEPSKQGAHFRLTPPVMDLDS